ncbi:TolC family protein [Flavobacterium sp. N3904]|uniref:TolC family protein n=1 Tax=Flavobacterium sp. N3904 TaxID=2986835 RepID=UPI002225247E|nr:TolC family protein [Flavobacterium sp. N3904]
MKKIILLTFLTFAITANAQEVKTLTLKEAITYALQNKSDAKKAKLSVENSEYQIQEVRSRALPQISVNGNMTYNPILQQSVLDGGTFGGDPNKSVAVTFGQEWSSGAGVSLSQTIFDQSVFTGLKAAKTTREFYIINDQLTEEQVIERVANNYYQVYVQRQKLAVLDSNYVNTVKVKNIIKGQFDNGLAKKIDLDRVSVKASNISTQRQQVLNAVQLQENALKFYMGMPIETKIEIPKTAFEVSPQVLSEAPNTANRTEYLLLKKNEELLEFQKKAEMAGYYPTLSLTAGYNYIGQGPEMPLFADSGKKVYWSDYSAIGLNLKIPVFTGFSTRSKVRQADVNLRSIKEDLVDTKLSLDLAYENAKAQIDNSLITIRNQKDNSELSQEVLSNTKNNYVQGLASLTDLLDAENAYIEAENNYNNAILDYKLAEIQLIKSKGELKTLLN